MTMIRTCTCEEVGGGRAQTSTGSPHHLHLSGLHPALLILIVQPAEEESVVTHLEQHKPLAESRTVEHGASKNRGT